MHGGVVGCWLERVLMDRGWGGEGRMFWELLLLPSVDGGGKRRLGANYLFIRPSVRRIARRTSPRESCNVRNINDFNNE